MQVSKSMLTASGKNGLLLADDINVSSRNQLWANFCQPVPDQGKVGEYIDEGEILVLDIDSFDIWLSIKLVMAQGQNVIEAEMDLKVEKTILLSEFNMLLQKLSLKVWNECCQVFLKKETEESKEFRNTGNTGRSLKNLANELAIDSSKSLFVLT